MPTSKLTYWTSPEGLAILAGWARDGVPDTEIARRAGTTTRTLHIWQQRAPAVRDALAFDGPAADRQVENALFQQCSGAVLPLRKTFKLRRVDFDPATGTKLSEHEELATGIDEIHVPASTTAQLFWLKNRLPALWGSADPSGPASLPAHDDGLLDALNNTAATLFDGLDPDADSPDSPDSPDAADAQDSDFPCGSGGTSSGPDDSPSPCGAPATERQAP
jgi:hypothetical protein